jgi:hypothetical protein
MESEGKYHENVFINCPFDNKYEPIFKAIVFSIQINGFYPKCAKEEISDKYRLDRILKLISECKYGIHDISRVEPDREKLPRFNMPFELGIFIGSRAFGNRSHQSKKYLVFDSKKFRCDKFFSDIKGIDPQTHNNDPYEALKITNLWLTQFRLPKKRRSYTGDETLIKNYKDFEKQLPKICKEKGVNKEKLEFNGLCQAIGRWIEINR